MTTIASCKQSLMYVDLFYGTTTVSFINWPEALVAWPTYIPCPAMKIEGIHNSGGLDAKPITIDVPYGFHSLFDSLVDGRAFPPVYLYLTEEITAVGPNVATGGAFEQLIHALYDYRLQRAYKNPDRQAGLIRLEFVQHKTRSKVPLGIPSTPECAWTLGDKSCQVDADALEVTATIAAIDKKKVTLTNPADAAVVTGQVTGDGPYWQGGLMKIDGLYIKIRSWVDAIYDFQLVREPPASWLGATVTLRPGCSRSTGDCTTKFSNISNFGGMGIVIPSYYPNSELS